MKNNLQLQQTLKHTFVLTKNMKNQLEFLKMNNSELSIFINEIANTNPFLEYTPSQDISLFLNDGIEVKKSLKDELYFQLHTCNQAYNKKIAEYIIESLDEHGFFNEEINDKETLNLIQSFEPIGVAAKNSLDAILIQLRYKEQYLACKIIEQFQEEIVHNNYEKIAKSLNVSTEKIFDCLHQIQQCSPFPCSNYATETVSQIIPDLEIIVEDNEITISPKEIGSIYLSTNEVSNEANEEVKKYFNEARFYIDSIHKRNKTLLMMVNELVKIQEGYFLYDDELNPCTLQEIADLLNFSKSTASRTLSNKYFLFKNTILPVNHLLVSKTKDGTSKDSIINGIQYLIENENKQHPLEDQEIVEELKKLELFVARRTVSKYRNILHIKNSKQRKIEYKRQGQ
ncbi:MAG: RNA polymerase subunit sigma-54 [Bacillota bacterium]|nr:RNA polymerase subunit sigma-54 [Bacillota bacterium]